MHTPLPIEHVRRLAEDGQSILSDSFGVRSSRLLTLCCTNVTQIHAGTWSKSLVTPAVTVKYQLDQTPYCGRMCQWCDRLGLSLDRDCRHEKSPSPIRAICTMWGLHQCEITPSTVRAWVLKCETHDSRMQAIELLQCGHMVDLVGSILPHPHPRFWAFHIATHP